MKPFFFLNYFQFFFFKRRCAYYYLLHDKPMALGCKHHLIFIFFLKKQIVCDVTSENEKNKYGGRSSTNTGAILVDLDPLFRGVRLTHLFLKKILRWTKRRTLHTGKLNIKERKKQTKKNVFLDLKTSSRSVWPA